MPAQPSPGAGGAAGKVPFLPGQRVLVMGRIRGTYQSAPWGQDGFHVVTTDKGGMLNVSRGLIQPILS